METRQLSLVRADACAPGCKLFVSQTRQSDSMTYSVASSVAPLHLQSGHQYEGYG